MTDDPGRHLGKRFEDALVWAAELHGDQVRKGTSIPYVSHLLAVCALVIEFGGTEDEAIAALLHDAVEDLGDPSMLDRIRKRFGDHVAAIVDACSDTDQQPKPDWSERKQAYLAHLREPRTGPDVLLVSACDKLHNLRSIVADHKRIGEQLWRRFNADREAQLWYYGELTDVFAERGVDPTLVDELRSSLDEITQASRA